jgi:DNA topoisomerase-1
MNIVVVESPAKAKTINKYLGPGYEVLASFGHIRDLPAKDGSVDPDAGFRMLWEVDPKSNQRMNDIARALKGADKLILATDPDREGEAISWHVLEVLKQKKALKGHAIERVVFNAITKQAVTEAMQHPRTIDAALVDAYLARRALDYLVGFTLSPVLWRKLPGARSAGRVQSVALRLVCDRELEIEKFVAREYWSIAATLATPRVDTFEARLVGADGQKIQRLDVGSGAEAEAFTRDLENASFKVVNVEAKPARRNPPPPFTTSTMQQEASRKLGFSPAHTMRLAQRLYEGIDIDGETVGLITYMRTDGIDVAPEAIATVRAMIGNDYGKEYVPEAPRTYQQKSKTAQEAHEAVRPTDPNRSPKDVARSVDRDQARLYELIWNRAVASQMQSAELERTTVDIEAKAGARTLELRATGQVVKFDGFLTLYQEGFDEPSEDDESRRLPAMNAGEPLTKQAINSSQHFTEPPPRYSEASLVKRMEELGIGRPSTYASTLQVLQDRGYVRVEKKRLMPEDKGRVVVGFLESFFQRYVEYDFTANLEEQLDKIANNEIDWKQVLEEFWTDFIGAVNDIKDLTITQVLDALNDLLEPHIFPQPADGSDRRKCPTCETGRLSLKVGRFGAFIGCSNYPECNFTRQMTPGANGGVNGTKVLGEDPQTGLEVSLRGGRFGPYLQLGEQSKEKDAEKPKRAGLPKGLAPEDVDLERALALLALPREVGPHPEDGEPIIAGVGRFGPYVKHGKTYANLEQGDDVLNVGLNRAVTLIAEKVANPGRGRRFGADPGKSLGDHPDKGGPILVKKGRYGPYVSHAGINATLPGDMTPDTVTLDQAIGLLEARAAKVGSGGPKARRAAGRKSASGKAPKAPAKAKKPAKSKKITAAE